jgi:hypothetical protein
MTGLEPHRSMVSKWWMRERRGISRDSGHQLKIYAESNHCNFQRIFGDFTSMETLLIYRELLVRNKAAV